MIIAKFERYDTKTVNGLRQYDYGQVLRIEGLNLPTAVEIHFALQERGGDSVTRVGMTKDGATDVVIPDSMLENNDTNQDYNIYAFVYLTDETSGQTEYRIKMPVQSRPRPEAFDRPEDAELFREAIQAVNESAERAESAAEESEKNAQRTAEDRETVKEMVTMVSDIKEQVQEVKEYKEQAQTAATNALQSENESEKVKEEAVKAQAGAESAADAAEQHALETAGDKAEVERLAGQVRQDKTSVEQTVQGFGNTVQQAAQSIGNVGVQMVQKVTEDGTKQVKSIEKKGQEVIDSIPEDFPTQMESKLDKNQGAGNAGKALVIGEDGGVVPGEVKSGDGIAIINTARGESQLVISDSAERQIKDLKIYGNSEQTQDPPSSPENPQEIRNFGKYNEETGKYEVNVVVNGANLLDEDHFFDMKNWKTNTYEMKLKKNTKYVFSRKDNTGFGSKAFLQIKNTVEGAISQIINSNSQSSNKQKVVFTTNETGVISFGLQNNSGKTLKELLGYAQLELGEEAHEHESYKEQTLTLTLDRQLTKWDKLVEQDGQIGWLYGSKKATFENAVIKNVLETNSTKQFSISYEDVKDSYSTSVALCNLFAPANGYELYTQSGKSDFYMGLWKKSVMFSSKKLDGIFQTKESFQEWLRQSELYIWHKTDNEEFIPLPQSEQDAIRALSTYYPTTVVTVDGGEVYGGVEVTYTADTKNYIDQKFEQINKTLVNTQAKLL